jgi:acyl-coenzyme A thioesterase PaaI-like protein
VTEAVPSDARVRGVYLAPNADTVEAHLGNALRRIMDAAVLATAEEAELRGVIASIDALSTQLEGVDGLRLKAGMPWPPADQLAKGDRDYNPVIGAANPLAPPMPITVLEDGSIVSELSFRPIHEGPPGFVHGGWVAALLDQLLGTANIVAGVGAPTGSLTIRYRKGTPFGVPLVLRARTDSIDGRRIHASGEITADGVVTAEAEGLFIRPSAERIAQTQQTLAEREAPR